MKGIKTNPKMTDFERASNTRWWQGACICDSCGNKWQAAVKIPIEATRPRATLECPRCHEMKGAPT